MPAAVPSLEYTPWWPRPSVKMSIRSPSGAKLTRRPGLVSKRKVPCPVPSLAQMPADGYVSVVAKNTRPPAPAESR